MDFTRKAFSNIIYLLFDWTFATALSFSFWFIIGKTLLPDQYGIIATIVNFASLISAFSFFGLNSAMYKLIPEFKQGKQYSKIEDLIKFSAKVVLASNIAIAIFFLFFSTHFAAYLNVPNDAFLLSIFIILSLSAS
ncbi:MAG: oligosaccharide flippase family protein, partial [Candidatus Aenigmatarchaeota archaeon]